MAGCDRAKARCATPCARCSTAPRSRMPGWSTGPSARQHPAAWAPWATRTWPVNRLSRSSRRCDSRRRVMPWPRSTPPASRPPLSTARQRSARHSMPVSSGRPRPSKRHSTCSRASETRSSSGSWVAPRPMGSVAMRAEVLASGGVRTAEGRARLERFDAGLRDEGNQRNPGHHSRPHGRRVVRRYH